MFYYRWGLLELSVLDFFRARPKKRVIKKPKGSGILFTNPGFINRCLFTGANIVFIFALGYLGYLYQPLVGSMVTHKLKPKKIPNVVAYRPVPTGSIKQPTGNLIQWSYEIEIPKIEARAKLATKVSPYNRAEYLAVLDEGKVAHAKGTPLPGEDTGQASFVFAHSTNQGLSRVRNNAVFYLLGELGKGDDILIHRGDETLRYQVVERKVVSAKDVSYLNYRDDMGTNLIIQTCWPIGTDWRRLLLLAKKI